jgi:4-amino-4-deoxy-L-arabinose transferase-like glycosyltransferase
MSVQVQVGAPPAGRGLVVSGRLRPLVVSVAWQAALLTAVAAALRLPGLASVASNPFYDAAVRSMSLSAHNFLFGAFDPGAALAIDKPPLDLWLQVASVKLFGWGSFQLKLPEALAGTLAVPLLYDCVRRVLGTPAGLAAGAALALLPESVLTARSYTMDSVMMLLTIAALWLTIRATARADRRLLVAAGVALGVAFNVKLLEALLPLPALAALYWLGAPAAIARRVRDLAAAGAALVTVGLAWAVSVSLAPGRHPWPIGSSDGTAWNAMFVFNGFGKVGGAPLHKPGGPGPLRLLVSTGWHSDAVFGCALLGAFVLGGAALLSELPVLRTRPGRQRALGSLPGAFVVASVVWLVSGTAAFDLMRVVHARYLEALAPAVAIGIGAGAVHLARVGSRRRPTVLVLPALAALAAYTWHFRPEAIGWSAVALALAAGGALLLIADGGRLAGAGRWLLAVTVCGAALLFPAHESLTLVRHRANDSGGLAAIDPGSAAVLAAYLGPRTAGRRYELAVDEPVALAPLIVRDQRAVLPLSSFGGRALGGVGDVRTAVLAGEVAYGLIGTRPCPAEAARTSAAASASVASVLACLPAVRWIRAHGQPVALPGLRGARLFRLIRGAA